MKRQTIGERLWFIRDHWSDELELLMTLAEEMFSEDVLSAALDRADRVLPAYPDTCPHGTYEDAVRTELLQLVRPR